MTRMSNLSIEQLFKETVADLSPALGESEARSAARIIFEDVRGMSQTDLVLYGHRTVEDFTADRIKDIVKKIVDGMPVQYAVGTARFYGLDFKVSPAVLIPRPETEGLVDMIVDRYKDKADLNILDCGTGSGCIAIALARNLPFAKVEAIDISDGALNTAEENAKNLKVNVDFHKADIFSMTATEAKYDIIVSNPPYIAQKEAVEMDKRVLDYEPAQALFVGDDDPLIFYRAIADFGLKGLNKNGRLYFEINPIYAEDVKRMLEERRYEDVDILRDYIGKYRYASARL